MLTSNVIHRILKIRLKNVQGTAFTVEHQNKQYLVTAKHLAVEVERLSTIQIFFENDWRHIQLSLTGISLKADIAVFAPHIQLSPVFEFPVTAEGLVYGQDVHFVGFPHDITGDLTGKMNYNRPFPLIKKACLSAFASGENGESIYLLDGHNNPGFSGSPVVFRKQNSALFRVCGVVSAYYRRPESVSIGGQELIISQNTGIVVCSDIIYAIEEIEGNPNGFCIADNTDSNNLS